MPISLIGSAGVMYLLGYSLNNLSLMALTVATGFVVDDAIVVLENIFRHIEEGLTPFQAAIKGVREISFAVIAMTLTLVAVFAPLAFTPGRTGRLFSEFALTLAGAVLVSGFVALKPQTLAQGPELRFSSNYYRLNGRPTFLFGSDTYANVYRSACENPWPWHLHHVALGGVPGGDRLGRRLDVHHALAPVKPGQRFRRQRERAVLSRADDGPRRTFPVDMFGFLAGNPMGRAGLFFGQPLFCLLYTSPSPRDRTRSRMPSSA